jgi:anti-sigma factor ChrR (cupin superfamily)
MTKFKEERRMTETASTSKHEPAIVRHIDEVEWETIRWPGEYGKMLFHPRPDRPTEPNAGLLRFEPGAHHPLHRHDFAQVWYIIEGEFRMAGKLYGPGTMLFYPDPHYEDELVTETGCLIVAVQYPGPTTGGRPIYDDRFNMENRRSIAAERTDI